MPEEIQKKCFRFPLKGPLKGTLVNQGVFVFLETYCIFLSRRRCGVFILGSCKILGRQILVWFSSKHILLD